MKSTPDLISLAGLVAGGLSSLETELNLHYVLHETFAPELVDLKAKDALQQQQKTTMKTRREAVKAAMNNCKAFIRVTRDVLKPQLGYQFSQSWSQVGFANGLRIPERIASMVTLMNRVHAYLVANPTSENAGALVTAVRAATLIAALETAMNAVAAQETSLKRALANRDAQAKQVRSKISVLTKELANVLTPLDPRWATFGLNQPGLLQSPTMPTQLTVLALGNGLATANWKRAVRAQSYHIWIKVSGVDEVMRLVGTTSDLDFMIENLPSGVQVEVAVSAVNNGGESALTAVEKIITPV